MNIREQLEANAISLPLPEFEALLDFFPEDSLLIYLSEDVPYVAHWVNTSMQVYRHGYETKLIGLEYWLPYHPQRLLPAPH